MHICGLIVVYLSVRSIVFMYQCSNPGSILWIPWLSLVLCLFNVCAGILVWKLTSATKVISITCCNLLCKNITFIQRLNFIIIGRQLIVPFSVCHSSPAVGFFRMLCCLHPWTTTTPSGRKDRSFLALSTPTSWKRSSQLPGPKPLVNQILQHPLLLSLHLYPLHPHSYPVRRSTNVHTNNNNFCTSRHFVWCCLLFRPWR